MKPGEFDSLVKQKFDQGGFEYDARNWDRLAEELDGKGKKRGLLLWWVPLIGIAATVAMAFGVSTVLRQGSGVTNGANLPYAGVSSGVEHKTIISPLVPVTTSTTHFAHTANHTARLVPAKALVASITNNTQQTSNNTSEQTVFQTFADNKKATIAHPLLDFNAAFTNSDDPFGKKKKAVVVSKGYYTFKEITNKEPWKTPKTAIILSGGINYGNQSNGYTVGASARRMINDHVYVEGDLAFISTNNTAKELIYDKTIVVSTTTPPAAGFAAKGVLSKNSTIDASPKNTTVVSQDVYKQVDKPYNLYYAQVTPTLGYKVMRRMSVGVGPDFQQMLVDNRPAASKEERGNIQTTPMFDIGFMGKTEYAISKNIKAAVYYREGINNIITPTDKYIDRNYLQLQVKCTILNR